MPRVVLHPHQIVAAVVCYIRNLGLIAIHSVLEVLKLLERLALVVQKREISELVSPLNDLLHCIN